MAQVGDDDDLNRIFATDGNSIAMLCATSAATSRRASPTFSRRTARSRGAIATTSSPKDRSRARTSQALWDDRLGQRSNAALATLTDADLERTVVTIRGPGAHASTPQLTPLALAHRQRTSARSSCSHASCIERLAMDHHSEGQIPAIQRRIRRSRSDQPHGDRARRGVASTASSRPSPPRRAAPDRLELCAQLDVGGTTPSAELITAVKKAVHIPVVRDDSSARRLVRVHRRRGRLDAQVDRRRAQARRRRSS